MNQQPESSRKLCLLVLSALIFLVTACAHYPNNTPISERHPDKGYRFDTLAKGNNSEDLFVILTFSGGGTRAAALSYGVMEKLRSTTIQWKGEQKSLLDEVDVISSISGGSFTSAFYGLFREQLFSDNEDGFKKRFLYRNIQRDLELMLFNPLNWIKLASPTYGRIDMASAFYNETIFENKSFDDLKHQGLPFFIINSTDMSEGSQFSFIQSQFDYLCTTLNDFRVARAVAASSNFPVAFTPLQVNNYADQCVYPKPKWIEMAELDGSFMVNPGRYQRAKNKWSYRDAKNRPFIQLLDGGLADNIGLRGPLASMTSNDISWSLVNKINLGKIKKLVVIVVDAKTVPKTNFDKSPSPPGVFKVLEAASTVPLDNYSADTISLLKKTVKEWQKDRQKLWKDPRTTFKNCPPAPDNATSRSLKPLDFYAAYIGFDQLADHKYYPPGKNDKGEHRGMTKEEYLNLATSFYLKPKVIDDLRWVGGHLLESSKGFEALKECLNKP